MEPKPRLHFFVYFLKSPKKIYLIKRLFQTHFSDIFYGFGKRGPRGVPRYNTNKADTKGTTMRLLIRWAVGAAALYVTVLIGRTLNFKIGLEGQNHSGGGGASVLVSALIAIAALTLVNSLVRPVAVLLTAPLNCLTLGLFSFVVNALMFYLVSALHLGLYVGDFWAALFGSIVLSVISGLLGVFVGEDKEASRQRRA